MAYCVDVSGNQFVLDPTQPATSSCTAVVFTGQEAFNLMAQDTPFDPVTAGAFWSFALVTVLFCWFMAKGVGALLVLLRR